MMNKIYFGDNLPILQGLESESVDLIYIDPPFNTGKVQKRTTIKTVQSESGDRKGFQGKSYETTKLGTKSYADSFDSLVDFLRPRLEEAYRILKPHGSLYFHIDYREVHYCKILLDEIFGRECFLNEIIWAYDYGGRAKSKWPPKHDTILYYVKDPENYIFNAGEIDREQYIAPGLVGPLKAERGKLPTDTWWFSYVGKKPTDTWWQTIVPTNGKERVGYPTQKPRKLLDRIIKASSYPGMVVLDFFAGSGTVGESCLALGRQFILVDNNPASLEVMAQRLSKTSDTEWIGFAPSRAPIEQPELIQQANTDATPAFDPEYLMLAASITHLQDELESENAWNDNPFEWILHLPPEQKDRVGKHLAASWCKSRHLKVDQNSGEWLNINGCKVAVELSMLDANGTYTFSLINKDNFDAALWLGISPVAAHGWVISQIGQGTLSVDPTNPPAWLAPCGGTLDQAFTVLKELSHRK
ncbi:MAG: site-specific DNA-methyltransferase [Anaerolineales bacterium]